MAMPWLPPTTVRGIVAVTVFVIGSMIVMGFPIPLVVFTTTRVDEATIPDGPAESGIVVRTVLVAVSMTLTELDSLFATYARVPLGRKATPKGALPTAMVWVTDRPAACDPG
jgi:hypothetical protein